MERETQEDESRLDLYAVLELPREASLDEIRVAFRKIAAKNHPDRNEGDSKAALRFKRANAAYQVLSDPEKRDLYDQLTSPVEELPNAPPPDAMVRGREAKGARAPEEPRGTQSTRRRRRRVRKTSTMSWAWGITIAAALLIAMAWVLVPEGGPPRAAAVSTVESSNGTSPAKGSASHDSVADRDPGSPGSTGLSHLGAPTDPLVSPGNPRERANAAPPAPAEDDVPVRTVSGDKWTFDIPTDWRNAGDANAPAWQAPGEGATVSLVVSTFAGEPAAFFKSLDRKSRSGLVVDNESWESESHPDGLRREGRVVHGGTVISKFVEYVVAVRGHGYDLRCLAPVVAFEGAAPMCDRILGSLQIK